MDLLVRGAGQRAGSGRAWTTCCRQTRWPGRSTSQVRCCWPGSPQQASGWPAAAPPEAPARRH